MTRIIRQKRNERLRLGSKEMARWRWRNRKGMSEETVVLLLYYQSFMTYVPTTREYITLLFLFVALSLCSKVLCSWEDIRMRWGVESRNKDKLKSMNRTSSILEIEMKTADTTKDTSNKKTNNKFKYKQFQKGKEKRAMYSLPNAIKRNFPTFVARARHTPPLFANVSCFALCYTYTRRNK